VERGGGMECNGGSKGKEEGNGVRKREGELFDFAEGGATFFV